MLSTADIAAMRSTAEECLPGTAVIQTQTFASDTGGGGSLTWTASGTVDCRIAPVTGNEQIVGERVTPEADWVVTLPAETSVTTESRIITGGGTFNVTALRAPRSYEISRRVEVAEAS